MNLHDWIDELCDVLDLEAEVDESLLAELATLASGRVAPAAGPVTTYLLGYAAASTGADPLAVEALAARAQELAERWDQPVLADPDDPRETSDPLAIEIDDIELGFEAEDDDEHDEHEEEEE